MTEESLELVFESPFSSTSREGQMWDGYFRAPASGDYRFYLACDDICQLLIDATNPLSAGEPLTPVMVAENEENYAWRNYLDTPQIDEPQYQSAWIPL